jgi:hypothetical protein
VIGVSGGGEWRRAIDLEMLRRRVRALGRRFVILRTPADVLAARWLHVIEV